jgi:hypothetical protein
MIEGENALEMGYGIANFKALREREFCCVDKTGFIEKLERYSDYLAFFRPRRFGKSLFLSTLEYYYDYKYKDDFDELFKGTWIGEHPTKERNSYSVLRLDFSGCSLGEKLEYKFSSRLVTCFKGFLKRNNLDLTISLDELARNNPPDLVAEVFFTAMSSMLEHPIYLLIDEYDYFANGDFEKHSDALKEVLGSFGFVRNFYSIVKYKTNDCTIKKIFITGVSPLVLDKISGDFNIVSNISQNPIFHDMMGFTTDEVRMYASKTLPHLDNDMDIERAVEKLKCLYDGYRFSFGEASNVLNPGMAIWFLSEYPQMEYLGIDLIDPQVYGDRSKLEVFAKSVESIIIFASLAKSASVAVSFNPVYGMPHDSYSFLIYSMFYKGWLTIADVRDDMAVFKIPNTAYKKIFADYLNLNEHQYNSSLFLGI